MQAIYNILFDTLPKQAKSDTYPIFLYEKNINKWFDDIPLVNYKVAIKSIYLALQETNKTIIPYKLRLYFLEKLHAPIIELAESLKKGNLHRSLPLNEKQQRTFLLIQNIHTQMVNAYKYVLRDLLDCHSFLQCPKKQYQMSLVIERIIRHHSVCLMTTYQFYKTPLNGQWSDIHHLFLLAHNENLLNKKVKDESFFIIKQTTIKDIYLQIVLLAIADPYNLTQLHIASIFNQLEEWAEQANIRPYQNKHKKKALVINLSSDQQPTFINIKKLSNTDYLWELGTLQLNKVCLDYFLDKTKRENISINQELLEKIVCSWKVSTKRNQNRNHSHSTNVNMIIGLNHIHSMFYSNTVNHDEYSSQYNSCHIKTSELKADIWKTPFQYSSALESQKEFLLNASDTASSTASSTNSHQKLYQWKIVNESPGGYSLLWDNSEAINAKIGKVIALSHENENNEPENTWLVGTIRWLKCITENKIQVGIHIIGNNPQAVHLSKVLNNGENLKSRAILLPENPILKHPNTLITTALGYKENERMILDETILVDQSIKQRKTKILLVKCLEASPHFLKFAYQVIKNQASLKESDNHANKENEEDNSLLLAGLEFDDMWGNL